MHSFIAASVLLQLANASPLLHLRQAVVDAISPSASAPAGCLASYSGVFGVSVQNITTGEEESGPQKRQFPGGAGGGGRGWGGPQGGPRGGQQGGPPGGADAGHEWGDWSDNDPATPCNSTTTPPPVAPTTQRCTCEDPPTPTSYYPPPPPITVARVIQIGDGQIQGSLHTITMEPINQIVDGQIQMQRTWTYAESGYNATGSAAPTGTATAGSGNVSPAPNSAAATNTPSSAASVTVDDEAQSSPSSASAAAASSPASSASSNPSTSASSTSSASSPDASQLIACRTNSSLQLSLSDSILTDSQGRTGYIASNYQFQFDNPPQSEAIYTAGWGVCGNGSLSLGGSTVFWQCLSGEFYNLYDRNWAAQCSPVEIRVVELEDCGGD